MDALTIKQSIDGYRQYLESVKRSKRTISAYLTGLNEFLKYLDSIGIDAEHSPTLSLNTRTFVQFPAYIAGNNRAAQTISVYLAGFENWRAWMVREELLPDPTMRETSILREAIREVRRSGDPGITRLPAEDDAPRIIQAARDIQSDSPRHERDLALALFLYTSGCRAFEAAKLKCKDINLKTQDGVIVGKRKQPGTIYFSEETAAAIDTYWTARGWRRSADPVFARHNRLVHEGEHLTITSRTVWNIIDELRKLAGIEKGQFSPHWMRHAAAMDIQRRGKDVILTAKFLRHRGLATVKIYAEATDTAVRDLHHLVFDK